MPALFEIRIVKDTSELGECILIHPNTWAGVETLLFQQRAEIAKLDTALKKSASINNRMGDEIKRLRKDSKILSWVSSSEYRKAKKRYKQYEGK